MSDDEKEFSCNGAKIMNMHGIIVPMDIKVRKDESASARISLWLKQRRVFLAVVVAPLLLLSAYLFLVDSNQFESEAHFLVRSANTQSQSNGGIAAMLSGGSSGVGTSWAEAMSVADYLTSHDAVETLRREDRLVERYHRNSVDILSRLRSADPTPEALLKYYQSHVQVNFDRETGITTLKVRGFEPQDSYQLASKLLTLGEKRVNYLNNRTYNDAIYLARQQLADVETQLAQSQAQLTRFRQARKDVDPQYSGQAQVGIISGLTTQTATARAQLQTMAGMISASSPQYKAVAAKVRALEAQVGTQSGRLVGGKRTIATDISGYEGLQLRQQFLEKRYEAAAANLERARETALKQQLYIVRVVNPNMPVKALYPERAKILGTALIALLIAYSIGWLIVAGVREHAA